MSKYDVILTLGNGLTDDWDIPPIVKTRLERIAKLYKKNVASKIIVSGKYSISFTINKVIPPITEAEAMKQFLIKQGINEEDILKEEESQDTIGNVYFTKIRHLQPNNFQNILLVCADFHLKRVKFLANKILAGQFNIDYQTTLSESFHSKGFMQIQEDILRGQSKFLVSMQDGDDTFLKERLYNDPYYKKKRPTKGARVAMKGTK